MMPNEVNQLKQVILDKIQKITPGRYQSTEFLHYDEYWHRFNGRVDDGQDVALCGHVFPTVQKTGDRYKDVYFEEAKELNLCLGCLQRWHDTVEGIFQKDVLVGIELNEENTRYVEELVREEGYISVSNLVNRYLDEHRKK